MPALDQPESSGARTPLSQLLPGTLEYCVLALLRDEERYGFELVRTLGDVDGLVTSEGTICPLLSRPRRDGLVETTWRESNAGPPRGYYRLTSAGRRALDVLAADWTRFRSAVDLIILGSEQQ